MQELEYCSHCNLFEGEATTRMFQMQYFYIFHKDNKEQISIGQKHNKTAKLNKFGKDVKFKFLTVKVITKQ